MPEATNEEEDPSAFNEQILLNKNQQSKNTYYEKSYKEKKSHEWWH